MLWLAFSVLNIHNKHHLGRLNSGLKFDRNKYHQITTADHTRWQVEFLEVWIITLHVIR